MSIEPEGRPGIHRAQWALAALILALAVGGVLYRLLVMKKLEQTAALFIGLPAVLAIILAMTPRAGSATGTIIKGLTIALLMSGPILGEGFICIVMAAPLFYLVGIIIGLVIDRARRREGSSVLRAVILLPLLAMSIEGVTPALTFATREEVTAVRIVEATPEEVERALAQTPRFERELPSFLRLKFPRPERTAGAGLEPGAMRVVRFAGGEGKPGDLMLRVAERGPSSVTFEAVSDTSHIAHWLTWRSSHVTWRPLDARRTEVTWSIVYDRELDPAWYFGPWERYATRLAAGVLIDNLATPR
ncbi:MAG TPA: SRPBCC family protein [Thermoanaerobaculia bacterium]|nr:SRPBCC family protein [Thermoanaerobaculia bacterium]